jgi:hypothetical protein
MVKRGEMAKLNGFALYVHRIIENFRFGSVFQSEEMRM